MSDGGDGVKNLFETVREIAWAVVVVLGVAALLAAVIEPTIFARQLSRIFNALETEGFDVKLKVPFAEASFDRLADQVASTDAELLEARRQIEQLTVELLTLRAGADSPAVPPTSGGPTISALPPMTSAEVPAIEIPAINTPAEWAVIAGAETNLESQRAELRRLQRAGFAEAVILKSGRWYMSAVVFPDRASAEVGLRDVSAAVGTNRGAYIRAMEVMCPDRTGIVGERDVYDCG